MICKLALTSSTSASRHKSLCGQDFAGCLYTDENTCAMIPMFQTILQTGTLKWSKYNCFVKLKKNFKMKQAGLATIFLESASATTFKRFHIPKTQKL